MFSTSDTTEKLDAALAKAQGEIVTAKKDAENPHFRSKYADLTAIWNAIRPALSKHGIAVTQWPIHSEDGRLHIITRLALSGEWIKAEFSIPVTKQDAQGYGSAVTYGKRFSLAAAIGVVAEVDDDGEAAVGRANGTEKPTYPKARSREPFAKLELALRDITDLTVLDEWWGKSDIAEAKARLPLDWQIDLFISFLKHGLKISESRNAQNAFFRSYEEAITNGITDDEKRNDLIETYKEAQAGWSKITNGNETSRLTL